MNTSDGATPPTADNTDETDETDDDAGAEAFARDYEAFKESVETRFGQVGEAFASLGGSGESGGQSSNQPSAAAAPKAKRTIVTAPATDSSAAQSGTPSAGGAGASADSITGDAKRPQSTHWWYRDAPWKRGK